MYNNIFLTVEIMTDLTLNYCFYLLGTEFAYQQLYDMESSKKKEIAFMEIARI